jgi:hypothetical protein
VFRTVNAIAIAGTVACGGQQNDRATFDMRRVRWRWSVPGKDDQRGLRGWRGGQGQLSSRRTGGDIERALIDNDFLDRRCGGWCIACAVSAGRRNVGWGSR